MVVTVVVLFALALFIRHFLSTFYPETGAKFKSVFSDSKELDDVHFILNKYFPYFQKLDFELQKYFLRRLRVFLEMKTFVTRKTKENKTVNLLIAAAAVQLTFGLKDFALYSFKTILIYPDQYFSTIRKRYHKGEVNIRQRIIVLSAKHFLEGIKDSTDGINLGLHEIAHALNIDGFEQDDLKFIQNFENWELLANLEMENVSERESHFLRKYAATNIHEMFAVCTENFFERPEEFKKQLPDLFHRNVSCL